MPSRSRARIVWIGHGKERETLDGFFAELGPSRAGKLVAVTMDMAQAYVGAVKGVSWAALHPDQVASSTSLTLRASSAGE